MARREPVRLAAPDVPPQEPRPYDAERHALLLDRMKQALTEVAPAGWKRIDLKIRMLVGVCDVQLTVVRKNGGRPLVEPMPELVEMAAEIRSLMYRPGQGTWFGMRFMMDPPDAFWVSYNRAFDPLWDPPLSAAEWRRDLDVFPRADAHVPEWLGARLGTHGPMRREQ
ncbi:hypothetical protein [Actinomadura sp. K4S16]|uniref:hypothetical protein n=1 Tax=Actinomadura sp. K4S16 TaxID=1316147 RepID=UPI0011ED88EF|nr:hypothetical protein [Actinomadura sp. K4S16]